MGGTTEHDNLTQFAGTHAIEVPAGQHTVVVENTGSDWFMVKYRLPDLLERLKPPVLAWAVAGRPTALAQQFSFWPWRVRRTG